MTQSPAPEEKQPINEQLANIALKIIKPGGLTCGGLGAFWFLFIQSDIPRAIASAVIGVGLSYGAKLLQPIHHGNQKRAEEAGKAIDNGIDQILKYLTDKATGGTPDDRYLACQALACQAARSEGVIQHNGIFTPLLVEVFVSLSIDSTATLTGFKGVLPDAVPNAQNGDPNETLQNLREDLSIWKFLEKTPSIPTFRQLAILAWGGSGKTTLLKHIAYCYGSKQAPCSAPNLIPFLLILRKHRDTIAKGGLSLPDLITTHHIPDLPAASDLQMPPNWAEDVLKRGNAIVMLDGFDEIPKAQRPKIARWINQQTTRYSKSVFLLTSRPKAYIGQHTEVQDPYNQVEFNTRLWVKDFSAEQRKDFVEKWYCCQECYANGGRTTPDVRHMAAQSAANLLDQIEARAELKALAKNPLLLNMIVTFHRRNPGAELPQRRVELYKEICQLQLKDRPNARKLQTLLTQCDAQTILQQIALAMMKQRWERISRPKLIQGLKKTLEQQGETIEAAEFLEQVVQISELLVQQEDEYEFAHLSFQEYLAAVQIAQTQKENLLYSYFDDDKWKPTILLYASLIPNPTTIIEEAVNRGATDLAYQCLKELPTTKRIDPALEEKLTALKETVQTSRYQKLEEYLNNGQWRKADKTTYELIISTVGKEVGQYFDPEELLNFPCEELLAIDALWVKYSNGKFGFSVQKDIYLKCGGIPDGKYDKEAFIKFGDAVEWRKNYQWSFGNVTYDTSTPKGHLPIEIRFCGGGKVVGTGKILVCLFSRIAHCKL
ncbi:MAG: GUN4 domain-containing protein [Leptolyngbyaceae cyanobacterium MO_188.B28]|nr:GUN4 domain-containing protein [Leptolyngbyaceae cyanobacterium MO_188.B28]